MLLMPCVIMTMVEGDDKDFIETLYRKYRRAMYEVARKFVHNSADADDIVSDACLSLIKNIDTLRRLESKPLLAYIRDAVNSTGINSFKKQKRLSEYILANSDMIDALPDQTDIEKRIVFNEQLDTVQAAMKKLSEKEQLIIHMKFNLELSDSEIAEQIGLSASSIPQYVSRARKHLKEILHIEQGD